MNQETKHYFALLNEQGKISKELAIHPEEYISDPFVVICDTYIDQVKKDKIDIYTSRVVQMEEKLVKLEDGTQINADIVIFCTGFSPHIPFFEENILKDIEFDAKNQFQPFVLYEGVFHPKLPNMAFVGMYRDPYFGIMELQARWACMAFANKEEYYPNIQELEEGIAKERSIRELNPAPQFPHGDCLTFADTLAKKIHVLPNIMGIDFAMIPARFRLQGPHSNPEMALQILMDYQRFILGAQ
ncbi:MAG: hypothetical protein JSS09_03370 [Verrucomicrobia bacterium]|nr:hypothetical protein [Verrucomicrobiota bacterium]